MNLANHSHTYINGYVRIFKESKQHDNTPRIGTHYR